MGSTHRIDTLIPINNRFFSTFHIIFYVASEDLNFLQLFALLNSSILNHELYLIEVNSRVFGLLRGCDLWVPLRKVFSPKRIRVEYEIELFSYLLLKHCCTYFKFIVEDVVGDVLGPGVDVIELLISYHRKGIK